MTPAGVLQRAKRQKYSLHPAACSTVTVQDVSQNKGHNLPIVAEEKVQSDTDYTNLVLVYITVTQGFKGNIHSKIQLVIIPLK